MSSRRRALGWLAAASFAIGALAPIAATELQGVVVGAGERRTGEPFRDSPPVDQGAPNDGAVAGPLRRLPRSERILAPPRSTPPAPSGHATARSKPSGRINVDPDSSDPALLHEHLALLAARPFLQRVPYRDDEVGVALDSVTPRGTPVLLVTFYGTLPAARRDLRAALARSHDRGNEYELRFERVSHN
jgi:hypothetical protein